MSPHTNKLSLLKALRIAAMFLALTSLSACNKAINQGEASQKKPTQALAMVSESDIVDNAENMSVTYQVLSNTTKLDCDISQETKDCYASELRLRFTKDLPASGWFILFSHLSPVQQTASDAFDIQRLNGDLHKLSPKKPIKAEQDYSIALVSQFWSVSRSDVLPNYFFVYHDTKTKVIEASKEALPTELELNSSYLPYASHAGHFNTDEQFKRLADDQTQRASAASIYLRNKAIINAASDGQQVSNTRIIPQISKINVNEKQISLKNGLNILWPETDLIGHSEKSVIDNLLSEFALLQDENGIPVSIELDPNTTSLSDESYSMVVSEQGLEISSASMAGISYAFVSLMQLMDDNQHLYVGEYLDQPEYPFRGVHLDVARNFRSIDFVKTLIKQMHFLKLNKLHLHLADDEGWRLEVDGLPELTQIGGFRCFDPSERTCLLPQLGSGPDRESHVNGFYTNSDYISLLQYAAKHHVQVIPSLDMPGHSRAAVKAMEARYKRLESEEDLVGAKQYLLSDFADTTKYSSVQHYNDNTINPCLPSTYAFVDKVFGHLIKLHQDADVPLTRYHIGADETAGAWFESPVCEAFIASEAELNKTEDLTPYFIKRVASLVESHGVIAGGWSDGMSNVDKAGIQRMQVNVWDPLMFGGHKGAHKFANANWRTILSFPDVLYFDFPYAAHPEEHGYYWATRATDSFKVFQFNSKFITENKRLWVDRMGKPFPSDPKSYPNIDESGSVEGIQAHLWSEVVRHDSVAQYMYFPRLASVAERAWTAPNWQVDSPNLTDTQINQSISDDWKGFSFALVNRVLPYLEQQNIAFRVPPPGVVHDGERLLINHIYGEMNFEYKQDGEWLPYDPAKAPSSAEYVRAGVPKTERYSRSMSISDIQAATEQ